MRTLIINRDDMSIFKVGYEFRSLHSNMAYHIDKIDIVTNRVFTTRLRDGIKRTWSYQDIRDMLGLDYGRSKV